MTDFLPLAGIVYIVLLEIALWAEVQHQADGHPPSSILAILLGAVVVPPAWALCAALTGIWVLLVLARRRF